MSLKVMYMYLEVFEILAQKINTNKVTFQHVIELLNIIMHIACQKMLSSAVTQYLTFLNIYLIENW